MFKEIKRKLRIGSGNCDRIYANSKKHVKWQQSKSELSFSCQNAKKTQEYANLNQRLEVEREEFRKKLHIVEDLYVTLKQSHLITLATVTRLRRTVKNLKTQIKTFTNSTITEQCEGPSKRHQYSSYRSVINKSLSPKKYVLEEQLKKLKDEKQEIQEHLEKLVLEKEKLERRIYGTSGQNLQRQLNSLRSTLLELERFSTDDGYRIQLEQIWDILDSQTDLSNMASIIEKTESRMNRFKSRLEAERAKHVFDLDALRNELNETEQQNDILQTQVRIKNDQLSQLGEHIQHEREVAQKRLSGLQGKLSEMTNEVKNKDDIISRLWNGYLEIKEAKESSERKYIGLLGRHDATVAVILDEVNNINADYHRLVQDKLLTVGLGSTDVDFCRMLEVLQEKIRLQAQTNCLTLERNRLHIELEMSRKENRRLKMELSHSRSFSAVSFPIQDQVSTDLEFAPFLPNTCSSPILTTRCQFSLPDFPGKETEELKKTS